MEVGIVGLDTLQVAVTYWEDAVLKMGYLDDNPLPAITVSSQKYIILPARITFSINLAFLYFVYTFSLNSGEVRNFLVLLMVHNHTSSPFYQPMEMK